MRAKIGKLSPKYFLLFLFTNAWNQVDKFILPEKQLLNKIAKAATARACRGLSGTMARKNRLCRPGNIASIFY